MHNNPHVKPGDRDVPKTGPLHHRLKNAPIDQIPISKAPRRQKSSRFYVTEKVQLEPTPAFHEVPSHMRPDLFIQKIKQCTVVFDFSDASAELREKEIKRQTLQEILDHISMNRGVLTENVYPEIINMVLYSHTGKLAVVLNPPSPLPSLALICFVLFPLKLILWVTHLIPRKMNLFWN